MDTWTQDRVWKQGMAILMWVALSAGDMHISVSLLTHLGDLRSLWIILCRCK